MFEETQGQVGAGILGKLIATAAISFFARIMPNSQDTKPKQWIVDLTAGLTASQHESISFRIDHAQRDLSEVKYLQDPLSQYEKALDDKYKEMKAAIRLLRENEGFFQKKIGSSATTTSATTDKAKGITASVRDAIAGMADTFSLNDLCAALPSFDRTQISNALVMLKDKAYHVKQPGRGQSPAVYGKGAKPS